MKSNISIISGSICVESEYDCLNITGLQVCFLAVMSNEESGVKKLV